MHILKKMSDKNRKILYFVLLTIGLLGFFVPFVLMKFGVDWDALINNGTVAFLICVTSICMIIGSCIGLCRRSERFKEILKEIIYGIF
jgi:hypothetical protein